MNLRTTFVLLLLLAAGAAGWYALERQQPKADDSASIKLLKAVTPESLTRIEIDRKGQAPLILERNGKEWTLPGRWPVRAPEVAEIVRTLTSMHSRFHPQIDDKSTPLSKFGLGDDALSVKLTVNGKVVAMKLGEEAAESNRFARPTFLKLDDQNEIIRLGPGVIASIDRPVEYFQQRRLFPSERVAKDDDEPNEKIEQIVADHVKVKTPDAEISLVKDKDGWRIDAPVKDRVDSDKIRGVLAGLIDIWADRFVTKKDKSLDEMGLAKPEYAFTVKRPGGEETTVLVGKISDTKERTIVKPAPPPQQPFMPPGKPTIQVIKEEYRYAKLPDNAQIFEIKTDKLKDLAIPLAELRDAKVARFKTGDVKKLEIDWKGKSIVLAKADDKWKIEKPASVAAERQPVNDILDKLADLEARGADVRDAADPKDVGLDVPVGKVVVTLEEGKKEKTTRTLVYSIGETAKEKGKLFIRLADSSRVNAVGDDLAKLAERDVLAYRQRRLLDVASKDLAKIQIVRGGENFTFAHKDGVWSQVAPTPAKLDQKKVDELAGDLAKVEASEFVTSDPDDLDKKYGLAKPALTITFWFVDEKKPSHTLFVGKQRGVKDDSFALLDSGPVFAIKKDLRDLLDRESLTYRPTQAWQVKADDIVLLRVKKGNESYSLSKDDERWKIKGPFEATVRPDYANAIAEELAGLKSEKYVAQATPADLAKFGLEPPYAQFEIVTRDAEKEKDKAKEVTSTLQLGKLDGTNRYARIGDGDGIFLVGDKTLAAIDRGPLDLLDRMLLKLNVAGVSQIRFQGAAPYVLEKAKDGWQIVGSPGPAFKADEDIVQATLKPWANLMAGKIAAYGPNIDWAKFGLEKPEAKIVVSSVGADKKAVENTLVLGGDAGEGKRFARVDQQQEVAVLERSTLEEVAPSYLDFIDPRVLKFPFDAVTSIERTMKEGDVELVKRDDAWQMTKPAKQAADSLTADDILDKTFQLKVRRAAAYPAKDLAKFGLEPPVATVTIHLGDDKKHVIKVGDKAGSKGSPDERYALIDGGQAVVVLPGVLSKHLTAPVAYFLDRNLASFGAADRLEFSRGERKAIFVKKGPAWEMIEPVKAEAEPSLGEFVQGLFRFRADEIVAAKDADLKSLGLDPPIAEWKVLTGDREVLDVLIGDQEKGDGKRRYAKLAKGEQVFLLSPKQSGLALTEYRDRKPWPSLDAAQVSRIVVNGEPVNFTLTKRENNWTEVDHPDGKVDVKAVTDLLDALAALKVDRYVADAKGNLQLFGLEKPAWKIETTTPTGSRTLLLGRAEGDSRRLYASVAGSDVVFTISEADAARLTRPLAAYLETK